jgi:tetratricopeptide (TPR) repeat protein
MKENGAGKRSVDLPDRRVDGWPRCLRVTYTDPRDDYWEESLVEDRIKYFERMLADNPDNPTGLLALANEYQKVGRDEDEAAVLEHYVSVHQDDEGNAYARLGEVLTRLGRKDEARAIYEKGIGQSEKHGHSGMAEDLRLAIIQLNE